MDWAFELLRQQKREAFSAVDREGFQPLHLAAKQGPINILQMLLNNMVTPSSPLPLVYNALPALSFSS